MTQSSEHSSDSVREHLEIHPHPVTLPEERAAMTLPLQTLTSLPEGAGYHTRQGRTSLRLTRRGDSLALEAQTDSTTVSPTIEVLHSIQHKATANTSTTTAETQAGLSSAPLWLYLPISITLLVIIVLSWHKIQRYLRPKTR